MTTPSAPALAPLDAPFDQYQRYAIAADVARAVAASAARPPRVLDVGGSHIDFWNRFRRPIAEFLPEYASITIDLGANPLPGYVRGRGDALPFATGVFDLVCSVDVLEHVPPPARDRVITEATRVAGRAVLLAAPFASPLVDRAEALVAGFIRRACGYEQGQLGEHRALGWPDLAATVRRFEACGWTARVFAWGNLWRWVTMMVDKHAMSIVGAGRTLQTAIDRQYNERHFTTDAAPPCYRHFVVAAAAADDPVLDWAAGHFGAEAAGAVLDRDVIADEVAAAIFEALEIHASNQEMQARLEPARRDAHVRDLESHRDGLIAALAAMQAENQRLEGLLHDVERSVSYRTAAWLKRAARRRS